MRFSTDERLYELFPGLKIGVLVLEIDNTKYGTDGLAEVLEQVRSHFPHDKPQDHPHIKVWREAFSKLGISASKYLSSIESLLRRALKGGPFPRINPLVDLYNAISLKYLVPMGGHAVAPLVGDIFLGFAEGTEPFHPMDSAETEVVGKGEVVYKDGAEVLTRRWVWRQCEKDKVTGETRLVFVPIDVMAGLPEDLPEKVMADMEIRLAQNGNGRIIHQDILTREKLSTTLPV
jgi:DNA/RNA-binding domain of Phe-tRNA-synthetase-like protein